MLRDKRHLKGGTELSCNSHEPDCIYSGAGMLSVRCFFFVVGCSGAGRWVVSILFGIWFAVGRNKDILRRGLPNIRNYKSSLRRGRRNQRARRVRSPDFVNA